MPIDRRTLYAVVVALFAVLLHAMSLSVPFFWDDLQLIVENAALKANPLEAAFGPLFESPLSLPNYFRPIPLALYAFVGQLAGFDAPWPFHLLSLLVLAGGSFGLFFLFGKFFETRFAAVLSCLVIGFPTNVEAVAWISALPDLLVFAFGTWFLVFYLADQERGYASFALVALFAAALFSKEGAVGLLAFAMIADLRSLRADPGRLLRLHLPLWTVFAGYMAFRTLVIPVLQQTSTIGLVEAPKALWAYAMKVLNPWPMGLLLGEQSGVLDWRVAAGIILGLGLLATAMFARQVSIRLGSALFLGVFLPYSQFWVILGENYLIAERYMPLMLVGAGLFLGQALHRFSLSLRLGTGIALLFLYSTGTYLQYERWQSPALLWQASIEQSPSKITPRAKYATILADEGRVDAAYAELAAAEKNLKSRLGAGHYIDVEIVGGVYHGLADMLRSQGRFDEAIRYARLSYEANPTPAVGALGVHIHDHRLDFESARDGADKLAARHPESALLRELAAKFQAAGEGRFQALTAVTVDTENPLERGLALADGGVFSLAFKEFERVSQLAHGEAFAIADIALNEHMWEQAIAYYTRGLSLAPAHQPATAHRAYALLRLGKQTEACTEWAKVTDSDLSNKLSSMFAPCD